MDNDDGYVPQISQIDYNLMDSGTNGNSSVPGYYNSMSGGHMPNMYSAEMQQQQHQFPHPQMMPAQGMPHGYPSGMAGQMPHGMMPGQMGPGMLPGNAQQVAPQPPTTTKSKRGGGRKKNAANQQTTNEAATPAQQPLPASYPTHQMNPQMMQQMRQQQAAGTNPYNYPMQASQSQQKWPADYMQQQQQYRPTQQQPYPGGGYPMHPSAQNYYAANQQRPPAQYYQQQPYPPHYPGQNPQQPRYPQSGQQYYMDPNGMYNYPTAQGYPQAQPAHSQQQQKPEHMGQQSFQQPQTPSQTNPYQQPKATPSASMTPNISQANIPSSYGQQPSGSSQQQPNSQWPQPYNGVPPPNYYQQHPMNSVQNLQREIVELERQYQQCGYQQRTPEVNMRMEQLYKKIYQMKQQLQHLSMQQAPSQQSPQTASNKGYPNYPSNGQVMDNSNANSTISPMGSTSSLHHSQSTEKAPSRTPTIPTQDPNSSVSVMQTTPNQVQVNITPEAPGGRTLISVYHQYPSADVMTNSTNATTPVTSSYAKDAIPPEPLPPSLSADQFNRNQHQNNGQIVLSSTPSTSTVNTTVTVESKSQSVASTTSTNNDYSNFPAQQTAPNLSPIPPQPIPTTSYNADIQRQMSFEGDKSRPIDDKPRLSTTAESSAEEHPIERVENVKVNDTRPTSSTNVESESLKTNEETVQDAVADKPLEQSENANETESFENELEDLLPPAAPRMITTNYEEDEEEYEPEVQPNEEERVKQDKHEVESQKDQPPQLVKDKLSVKQPAEVIAEMEPEEPVIEATPEIEEAPIQQESHIEPSTSTKEQMEVVEKPKEEPKTTVELPDESMEFEEEEEPKASKSQPKKKARTRPPPKGRKSTGTAQSRKRKKVESEEEEDENVDDDFVPETPSKKRSKGKSSAAAKVPLPEEPKLEDFVEKRRSERNRTERKTYSEKMDLDEDLLEEIQSIVEAPSVDEDSPSQPAAPEWTVEKILGVRVVTKMLPKEPEEDEEEEVEQKDDTTKEATEKPETTTENSEEPTIENGEKPTVENGEKSEMSTVENGEKKEKKEPELEEVQVEEIYVKFKNRSYLHCEWKSVEELEEIDRRIVGKINRFKAKYGEAYLDDSEYFNEDYTVVDRVLDEHIDEESGEHSAFIKWRSLPYEDCTWEDIEIVPKLKLDEYHRRNDAIDPYKAKERSRPEPEEWVKIPKNKEYKFENTLRDYQIEGVNWLLYCWFNRQNCILADEMGLGKTIQTITFLQGVYDKGIHGPFLIVVPLSTLHNWEREFEAWTDMNAVVYHGGAASREIIQNYEIYYDRADSKKKQVYKFDALLTTYEMVVADCEFLRKINYRVCVIDEAHRLKNRNSKLLTGGLLSFKMEHRVLLTGTPLQNNIQELFSLLNFLEPEQFGNSESFLEQFGQCQTEEQVQKLQEILKPMMLRRLKEDVEKTLQPKEETIIEVQLTNAQKKYYRAVLERNFTHLIKGTSVPSLMNVVMQLRHVCNHPFLLRGAEEQIIAEFKSQHPEKNEEDLQLFSLIQSSGKVVLIDKLLPKLRQDGHKVLIFSQMVRVLDILEEFLVHMNYPYERIDGNIRGDHRQAAIDRFSKPDSDRFVFLLCTRAGGLGINLVAADTVIIFDSDWNPQNDLQAQARCHRIGQTKMVKVYRLITTNTYEREMFDKASLKLGLDKAVLQSMTPKDNQQQLSRKEVEDLLRKGAYGAVMDDESESNKFSEEDIDTILSRRTQTIRLEPGVKGSTFAKASFAASNNREDIDVNDPQFWSKWAKKANVDANAGEENDLIISEPRARRKRFEDNYKGLHEGENESDGSDDDGTEPGGSKRNRGGDFSKSRSGKKRRRDDDEDYINYNAPDELTFNKSEFFKVEKLLAAYGWGRWRIIKEQSDLMLSEKDIEHIARTLLLHCIREFRGDEKSREFVWQLIVPKGAVLGKGGKKGIIGGGLYHEGWAALPEFNPPAFAVDSSFQRHVHRHANKLMQRMFHLFVLQAQILGSVDENTVQNKSHSEIPLDVPVIGDPPLSSWDADCDKSFLIGIYKHGMENFEAIRGDSKLCFIEKQIEEMPTTIELNTRFKRLILMLSRKLEMALAAATNAQNSSRLKRWPKAEENEFMRLLRIYGVKDDHEGLNVINWKRFRELSTNLQQKTDAELLEELYCVLAMCTKQQGGELSDIDRRRASLVDSIPAKQAERLMFRLHLMRKIHAIITTGIQNVRTSLKLCSNKTMPNNWGELQDEQLMIIADTHGLDNMVTKVSQQPAFEKLKDTIDEQMLLRRIMEICTTLETGRWNGKGSIEMLEDDGVLDDSGSQTPVRSLSQQQSKRNRKKNSTGTNPFASASPANASQASSAAAAQAMMEAALLPLLTASATSGTSNLQQQQQLQQFQALMTMYALSSMLPMSGDSSTSAANKQAMAALAMMGEDALNLTNSKKSAVTSLTTPAKPTTSTPASSSAAKSNDLANQLNISELLSLFNIPEDTNIPVVNIETNVKLTGDKAPKLKNLDQWLAAHPKYRVDTSVMGGPSPSTVKETTTSAKTEKTEVGTSNGVFKTPEVTETPKATSSITTTEAKKANADIESVKIGVFYKSTGVALPQDKWPSITSLESWLTKNPNTQVQTVFAPFAKELLPKTMHDRIGGEPSATQSTSASNSLQQAASSAAAANLTNAMNLEFGHNLQIQLYLQQKMMESLNPSAYQNPYSALLGAAGSSTNTGLTSSLSSSNSGLDANSAALLALFGAQLPASSLSSSQTSTQAAKSSTTSALNSTNALSAVSALSSGGSSALMNEAALTAEILANPSLALLLNSSALTNNNSAASLNSSLSSLPFGMDFNTALQLNALTSAANLNSLAQCAASSNANSSSVASLLSTTPASSTKKAAQPASNSAGRSKLDAVVEKLASSSSQNANNNS